jgi:hypothetical protein
MSSVKEGCVKWLYEERMDDALRHFKDKGKVKQSHYKPGQALVFPVS